MALNEAIPFYRPGKDITIKATVALTGKRLCVINGARTAGPGLASTDDPAVYPAGLPAAGGKASGVVGYDIASGAVGPMKTGGVLPVTTSGAIAAAMTEVMAAADGTILTHDGNAAHAKVGIVLTPCASGADAEFVFYVNQAAT